MSDGSTAVHPLINSTAAASMVIHPEAIRFLMGSVPGVEVSVSPVRMALQRR